MCGVRGVLYVQTRTRAKENVEKAEFMTVFEYAQERPRLRPRVFTRNTNAEPEHRQSQSRGSFARI